MSNISSSKMISSFNSALIVATFSITTFLISLTNLQLAFLLLLGSIVLDFVSGIYASFIESLRSSEKIGNKIKGFRKKLSHFFFVTLESEKFRKSILKTIAYLMIVFLVYFAEIIFYLKQKPAIAEHSDLIITLYVVGFCTAIELYSTIFENFKRSGFDLSKKITTTTTGIKENWSKIKGLFTKL